MDRELQERVILERVELIARLTTTGICMDKDREIALSFIAELAQDTLSKDDRLAVLLTAISSLNQKKREVSCAKLKATE